ncbi:uncharacterized protein LOC135085252 [Ostrinia nubilalis]|uniref:uncharacterized protein LOC135085252 n=1 Tax=Ostrinia nubilalis TaxID=29057 RepID=UPI00308235AE
MLRFKRDLDASYPHVWDRWEAYGKTWIIQDLPPEDDETALQMMVEHWLPDEPLSFSAGILDDPVSLECFKHMWRECLSQRMSLGCYTIVEGQKNLVGANVCMVMQKEDNDNIQLEGKRALNVYGVLLHLESMADQYEHLGTEKVLDAFGLVVHRDYRGCRLGGRILAAREPLSKSIGVKGTVSMFTGPASQKLAKNCGFTTISKATWSELADVGLDFPREDKVVKYMIKKFK